MKLFENETINISKIYTVCKYEANDSVGLFTEYGTFFHTYELVYFLKGNNITHVDNVKIHDTDGSLRYMPKGQTRGRYTVRQASGGICFDIFFDTDSPMPPHALGMLPKTDLSDKFIKLYRIWESKKIGYYSAAMAVFYEIIFALQNEEQKYTTVFQQEYMKKAYDFIAENFKSDNFDYNGLCRASGLKYTYFIELFKKTYNMTPTQLVTKMRIDYAKELLITSRYSISEIAKMCGFENIYYFSNVFKKQTGFSPSKYFG